MLKQFAFLFLVLSTLIPSKTMGASTLFDPITKAKKQITNNQFNEAQQTLTKRISTKDSANPALWFYLSKTNIPLNQNKVALTNAFNALKLSQKFNTEELRKFEKKYAINTDTLDQFFIENLNRYASSSKSHANSNVNTNLLVELTQFNPSTIAQSIPKLLSSFSSYNVCVQNIIQLNDTIYFNNAIGSNNILKLKEYLLNQPAISVAPPHLKQIIQTANDSLESWSFEEAKLENTEESYLKFCQIFPESKFEIVSKLLADSLAYVSAKQLNTTDAYNNYLKKYPNGISKKKATYLLKYLRVNPVPFLTREGKFIYVDSSTGELWIDSAYDFAYPFSKANHKKWFFNAAHLIPGCALVLKLDEYDNPEFYYIEKDGSRLNTNTYEEINQFSKNLAFVSKSNRHGILNSQGREIIPCKFPRVFYDTTLKIGLLFNGKSWGIFNKAGKLLTGLVYSDIANLSESNEMPFDAIYLGNGPIPVKEGESYHYINPNGNIAIPGPFANAHIFINNIAKVSFKKDNKEYHYLINTNGKVVSDTLLDIENLTTQYYLSQSQNKTYSVFFISQDSMVKLNFQSENRITAINNNSFQPLFLCSDSKNSIIYNQKGNIVYKSKSQTIESLSTKFFIKTSMVNMDSKKKNKKVKTTQMKQWFNPISGSFSMISGLEIAVLNDSILAVQNESGWKVYHVNEIPLRLINPYKKTDTTNQFNSISQFDEKAFLFEKNGLFGLIDATGYISIENKFKEINPTAYPNQYIVRFSPKNVDESDWGTIFANGRFNIEPHFDGLSSDEFENFWLVNYNAKNAWLDSKGNLFAD